MKKLKQILSLLLVLGFTYNPIMVLADSGIDSNYESDGSMIGGLINLFSSLFSFIGKLVAEQPGGKDYASCHIITGIICILIMLIVTAIYVFKLDIRKKLKPIFKILISLIPTVLFSLLCFLTELELVLYIFILIVYIIPLIIIINKIVKNKYKKYIAEAKKIDTNFNEEEFNKETFEIYKEVQIAWSNFEIDKVKDLISDKIYDKYQKKLEELKKKNHKNMMSDIEFKSNKITDMYIKDDIETVVCQMNVECIDYIIDDKDKIIKGKKDKKYNYTYILTFSKKLKDKKYVLVGKKMKKIKI